MNRYSPLILTLLFLDYSAVTAGHSTSAALTNSCIEALRSTEPTHIIRFQNEVRATRVTILGASQNAVVATAAIQEMKAGHPDAQVTTASRSNKHFPRLSHIHGFDRNRIDDLRIVLNHSAPDVLIDAASITPEGAYSLTTIEQGTTLGSRLAEELLVTLDQMVNPPKLVIVFSSQWADPALREKIPKEGRARPFPGRGHPEEGPLVHPYGAAKEALEITLLNSHRGGRSKIVILRLDSVISLIDYTPLTPTSVAAREVVQPPIEGYVIDQLVGRVVDSLLGQVETLPSKVRYALSSRNGWEGARQAGVPAEQIVNFNQFLESVSGDTAAVLPASAEGM